jgi:predicted oxidoreductase
MKELIDVGLTTFDGADIYGKFYKIIFMDGLAIKYLF